jgi:hypothetical protein
LVVARPATIRPVTLPAVDAALAAGDLDAPEAEQLLDYLTDSARKLALEAIDAASPHGGKQGEIEQARQVWRRATPCARPSPTRPP